jgi:hypothetical protein
MSGWSHWVTAIHMGENISRKRNAYSNKFEPILLFKTVQRLWMILEITPSTNFCRPGICSLLSVHVKRSWAGHGTYDSLVKWILLLQIYLKSRWKHSINHIRYNSFLTRKAWRWWRYILMIEYLNDKWRSIGRMRLTPFDFCRMLSLSTLTEITFNG